MANFQFLNGIKEIAIIADNDTPRPVGYRAAYDLAMRAIKQGIKASIWQSETAGYDALDELNEKSDQTIISEDRQHEKYRNSEAGKHQRLQP